MKPGRHDVVAPRGQAFTLSFLYRVDGTPVDVTGLKVALVVRANRYDDEALTGVDNFTDDTFVTLGGVDGTVSVTVPEAQVAELGTARALWYTLRTGVSQAEVEALFGGVFSLEDW